MVDSDTTARKWISWNGEDNAFLRKYYGQRSTKWIGRQLKRTAAAVTAQAGKMGLRAQHKWKRWSQEELEFLEKQLPFHNINWIAKKLNRSYGATQMRAMKLDFDGRLRCRKRDGLTNIQAVHIECQLLNGINIYQIAAEYDVSATVVARVAINMKRKPPPSRAWQEYWSKGDV